MKKVVVLALGFVLCTAVVALAGGYDNIPDGMEGFSGTLRGKVVAKVEKGFVLKVEKILKLWEGNKAKNPKSAIGKKLLVGPRWVKGDNGKWHPYELHLLFIKKLKVGQVIVIELIHQEGNRLSILELNGEQRLGKIEHGKPEYEPKDHKAWAKKGRIVGRVRNAPKAYEVAALNSRGRVVKSAKGWKKGYELEWLSPGTYTLRVSAKGYATLKVKGLKVKARHDLFVNLEFTSFGQEREEEAREKREKKEHEEEEREEHREEKKREHEREKHEKEEAREREKREKHAEEKEAREKREKREKEQVKKHKVEKPMNWPKKGGILGMVTSVGSTTISVKVLKASKNARAMVGETVTFYANWIKNRKGKWVPDPEEVALIKSCDLEDKVEIHFYFEEHYRIKKLEKEK